MSLESFNYIDSLNTANPTTTDNVSEGDDHIRGIKTTLKNTFPNINAAVTATDEELNYVDGVTSNIQTQLGTKLPLAGGTMTGDVSLGDSVKANFGASDNLKIWADANTSYLEESGAGDLVIRGNNITLQATSGEQYLNGIANGGTNLFYDNATKLATTSTGVDVTGSVTCDGFTSTGIDDNATSTAITIDASENVGIGVTPTVPLQIRTALSSVTQTTPETVLMLETTAGSGDMAAGNGTRILFKIADDETNPSVGASIDAVRASGDDSVSSTDLVFSTSQNDETLDEALRITNDGRGLSQFTAKAWVNFNGTGTVAINDSHNVSSITDSGVGMYYINFTNSLANANHASTATPRYVNGSSVALTSFWDNIGSTARTPLLVVSAVNAAWSTRDSALITAITFGD